MFGQKRDEPSFPRTPLAFLGLIIVIGVFWIITSNRFGPSVPAGSVADVGPQTLAQLTGMGKPGVLELYTSNCPWCTKMEPELAKLEEQYPDTLFVVKMNAEEHRAEAVRYRVQAVPTLIYFDSSGSVKANEPGFRTAAEMAARLKELGLIK
ncbi:MAG: thioredoxin family protein [Bacillota bacterium]